FELYNKLRELPLHHDTAVIFVTDFSETKYPPGTVSNSETQFLAKPNNMLSYLELALKALSRVLKLRASSPPKALPAPVDPEARHEHDSDTTDNCANNAPAEPDTAVPTHGPDAGRKAIEPTEEPTMTTTLNHRPHPNESQTKPHAPAMNGEAGKRT